jgi:Rad3-related DNA helicase
MALKDVLQPPTEKHIVETIERMLQDFVEDFLPEGFTWRKGQKEAILEVIKTYREGKYKTVILDAPVGSGKSLIGTAVSFLLNKMNKRGFLLASDISLQEQYEKDFKDFGLPWGSVKGIDNYLCTDNMEKNSLGTCRIRNQRPNNYHCYDECPYFSNRNKAVDSDTSLLNYSYWMIMMNYVNAKGDDVVFSPRDFLVCDEAHKILDIVQNHFSPRFDDKTIEKIQKLTEFFNTYNIKDHTQNEGNLSFMINKIEREEDPQELLNALSDIETNLQMYLPSVKFLKEKVKKNYPHKSPPKSWRRALRLGDWLKDLHCKVQDYNEIIYDTDLQHLIKNPSGDDIVFNCLEERHLMNSYFHRWSKFTVLMSATFSDPSEYLRQMALPGAKYIKMESHFDYSDSPIYFYNKRRMSYKHIETNLPWLTSKIDEVLKKYPNENGIIHSASYHLTLNIYKGLSKENQQRCLVYTGTEEKREMLKLFKENQNKVLIGPSLLEGLDLKDDHSRFQIFAKVPYLSLGDRFVKAKMEANPQWYKWKAIVSMLQGVGRSIRNENDWAHTYILDGALGDLFHSNLKSFPPDFIKRIQICE